MKNVAARLMILEAVLALYLQVGPAQAQATRTWVSGVGDDAHLCTRTEPCKTFAGALSKTATGGEISVLDPGGFGAVTITKSLSITNDGVGEAGVFAPGTTGITINAPGGSVNLRGLVIDGGGTGINGINFIAGASLHVERCIIRNFDAAAPNGFGIRFAPNSGARLFVSETAILKNGTISSGGGIMIGPSGTGKVLATLNRIQILENGAVGVQADSSGLTGGGSVHASLRDSVVSTGAAIGIEASTGASRTEAISTTSRNTWAPRHLRSTTAAAAIRSTARATRRTRSSI